MAATEMTTRILKMYESMDNGREIQKVSFCKEHGISERTFERDIQKIKLFLSEEYSGREVQYCSDRKNYQITGSWKNGALSFLELALIIKILKSEQILEKNEFEGIVRSLQSVTEKVNRKEVEELLQQEILQYEEKDGKKAFLKLFWDLLKCISDRNMIQLKLKKSRNEKKVKFFPVAIEYKLSDFYLLGYQPEEEQSLVAFVLDEIEFFQITMQKYGDEIIRRYNYQEGKCLLKNDRRKGEKTNEAY